MGGSMMSEVYENNNDAGLFSLAITNNSPVQAPIISSYNDHIRPLLDTVDRLRNLNVMKEGIQLPTIVVVGDQSSGKSSVLESLAGISLPRAADTICTRVPLVMRLQRSSSPEPKICLKYGDKSYSTDEEHITEDICTATEAIAGKFSIKTKYTPLELYVRRQSVPDLTMVDLPGITRNPVKDQPEDLYEQVSAMIKKHIEPQESIILNVLAATCDFSTSCRRLISKIKEQSVTRVIEMEKLTEYTCNPEYTTVCTQKIAAQANFVNAVSSNQSSLTLAGFGTVSITHLRKYPSQLLHQAFDMKVSMTAYWSIVVRRIVDSFTLYLQFTVKNLVNSQFQKEIVGELGGGGDVEKMLDESPSVACKREKLKNSIKLLKESKEAVAAVLDQNHGQGYRY
ncbi:BnaA08g12650D [Brassica napus]|uniref:BnaA08g12650D protein n=1 Tax=Brassica napus TaxID=3708 RepID=A0A078GD18_BRANA|nr:BnaA08g12650D [Brassica napus]